jgi:hypothetical protein
VVEVEVGVVVVVGVEVGVGVEVVVEVVVEVEVVVGVEVVVEVGAEVVVGGGVVLNQKQKGETKMKVLVEQVEKEGLESLLGKEVTFFCVNYIYAGKLVGVNETCVKLENPKIVYETGAFSEKEWKDAQALPKQYFYLMLSAVESFGECK